MRPAHCRGSHAPKPARRAANWRTAPEDRIANPQARIRRRMSDSKKYRIAVEAIAEFIPSQSDPDANRYVFAYHITITNRGSQAAKLISRHWIITDGSGRKQEVRGEGVIGEQPQLAPGEQFRYTSGSVLETPVGTMHGSYQMVAADGHRFDAPISPFTLAMPRVLH
jgi:ApaG protein